MSGIENMELIVGPDDAAGENIIVRFFWCTTGDYLAFFVEVQQVFCFNQIPGNTGAVVIDIPPIVEIKQTEFAIIPEGNKVGSGSVLGLIVIAVGMFFDDKTSFYSLKDTAPDMRLQFSINSVSRQRDMSSLPRSI